jgi:hypothetical protein
MAYIGPFFYINNKLISNKCLVSEGRKQFDKIDNSYGHEELYDINFSMGDYIDYPRGRVVWDTKNNQAIIYIDKCINNFIVISKIKKNFDLDKYIVKYDEHYHCKKCIDEVQF